MSRYRFDHFVLDVTKRELLRRGTPVKLSARAFDCLAHLVVHRDRDVGRDELVASVFGRMDVSDAQLAQIVFHVRKAIHDDGHTQRLIRTVPRFGFRWVGKTEATRDKPPAAEAPAPHQEAATTHPRWWQGPRLRWAAAVAGVATLATGLIVLFPPDPGEGASPTAAAAASQPEPPAGHVLVLPSQVDGPFEAAWVRLGLMDFTADRLRRAGLPVAPSESTLLRLQASGPSRLAHAPDVGLLVDSTATHKDGRWTVALAATDNDGITLRGQATDPDLLGAARAAGDELLAALGLSPAADDSRPPGLDERLQRAQAAMLANELDTAREILRAAPELQQQVPQLRHRLAQVDYRAGWYEQVLAQLDTLLAEPEARDPLFRARLLNTRGASLIRLDRHEQAERDFTAAVGALAQQEHLAELGQALNGRGVTRLAQGDFDGALDDLGRSRVLMMRIGDRVGMTRADANMGHLERRRNRPHLALTYFSRAAADFESLGAINELIGMRSMMVDTHLQLLRPDLAAEVSERTWPLRPRVGDAAHRALVDLDRARALLHTGQLREARTLLAAPADDTLPTAYLRDLYALHRVELALQSGRAPDAVRMADAALANWSDGAASIRPWMLLRREQAALTAELPDTRGDRVPPGRHDPTLPGLLIEAIRLRRTGDDAAADRAYGRALTFADETGVPAHLAEVALAYVPWLIERGRMEQAAQLAGRVAPWTPHHHELALLLARLYQATDQLDPWRQALKDARHMAGERTIPPALAVPPSSRRPK